MTRARPIFHLHIRKAAGIALRKFMCNKFPVGACLGHSDLNSTQDPAAFQFISGHADFDYVRRFTILPRVVTALREPLDRALSAYYFARSEKMAKKVQTLASKRSLFRRVVAWIGQPWTLQRMYDTASAYDLAEMLQREPALCREEFGNVQTRCLAGAGPYSTEEELLAAARRNLESCEAVLLTERMDESLTILCRTFGWHAEPRLPQHNITQEREGVDGLSPTLRSILLEMNRLDVELYQHAVQLFERRRANLPDQEIETDVWPVPDARDFTFDQPIRGSGWHARGKAEREWFAWTGPEARLCVQSNHAGAHHLRLRVRTAVSGKALRGLQLKVNGESLPLKQEGSSFPCELTGMVPESLIRPAVPIELVLRPGDVRLSSDLNPAAADRRWLGLAISGIRLTPVGAGTVF